MASINKRRNSPWRGIGIQDDGVNVIQAAALPIDIGTNRSDVKYKVRFGETLMSISSKFYGSPFSWQFIADRNDIDYPLDVEVGDIIFIPAPSVVQVINGRRTG